MTFHSKAVENGYGGVRKALVIDKRGITVEYQKGKDGGGFYTADYFTFPWPWRKES